MLALNDDDFCSSFLYLKDRESKHSTEFSLFESKNSDQNFLKDLHSLTVKNLRNESGSDEHLGLKYLLSNSIEKVLKKKEAVIFSIEEFQLGLTSPKQKLPITKFYAAPMHHNSTNDVWGVLFVALNPLGNIKTSYGQFLQAIVSQIESNFVCSEGREEELRRMEEMRELNNAKTVFFSNISHEFRTPLTLMFGPIEEVKNYLTNCEDSHSKDDAEHLRIEKSVELLERNTFRLYQLVNDLLEFAKVEAQKITPVLNSLNLSETTLRTVSDFKFVCEKKGIQLVIQINPSVQILMDENLWERIVVNLVSNAFKYTLKGSIQIGLRGLKGENGTESIEFSVKDTGCGILKENIPHLFERFYRVEEANGRSHEGVGIGLSLVDQYVHLMNGTIRVESELGVGSCFTVTIPKKNRDAKSIEPTKSSVFTSEFAPKTNLKISAGGREIIDEKYDENDERPLILIVDDNSDMRTYLSGLLKQDYRVIQARDGEHAMERVKQIVPDLILCDIMMPKVNGIKFVKWLRDQKGENSLISVIFLTAKTRDGAKSEALDVGADDFLVKPFSSEELFARIRSHIKMVNARKIAVSKSIEESKKDLFLASLSHELRTPLAPVLLLVEELNAKKFEDKEVKELLKTIHQNIKTEIHLIDDLLDFMKLSKGKMTFKTELVDAVPVIESAFQVIKEDGEEKGLKLNFEVKASNHHVEANTTKLQQIVWNLLRNAIKFTPREGNISVILENPHKDMLKITVKDSGIGIDKEVLSSIFEPFNQGDLTKDHQYGGLGLGLNIAFGLTRLHNGTLRAESEGPNKGSSFIVEIPTLPAPDKEKQASVSSPNWNATTQPINILLVEDNKPTLMVMNRLLSQKLGHHVKTAESYQEAMEVARGFHFDMLISDIGLPDKSGVELVKALKAEIHHSFYSVAATGYGAESDVDSCYKAGFDGHITKPVSFATLSEMLSKANIQKK
eukprot:TRINITY_DN4587_c0_g1_i1.p1 TRINITY_DN4587_c0_g1~~TRINITY_DN4587_c0_g1_i1.p1  ORF type:complete len:1029 (+),score=323.46 TRINITY_DN4587_c0_g1_i1:208-3087(+)